MDEDRSYSKNPSSLEILDGGLCCTTILYFRYSFVEVPPIITYDEIYVGITFIEDPVFARRGHNPLICFQKIIFQVEPNAIINIQLTIFSSFASEFSGLT